MGLIDLFSMAFVDGVYGYGLGYPRNMCCDGVLWIETRYMHSLCPKRRIAHARLQPTTAANYSAMRRQLNRLPPGCCLLPIVPPLPVPNQGTESDQPGAFEFLNPRRWI